jgi:hypothetical protein
MVPGSEALQDFGGRGNKGRKSLVSESGGRGKQKDRDAVQDQIRAGGARYARASDVIYTPMTVVSCREWEQR